MGCVFVPVGSVTAPLEPGDDPVAVSVGPAVVGSEPLDEALDEPLEADEPEPLLLELGHALDEWVEPAT